MANNPNLVLKNILTTIQSAATLTQVAKWLYTSQPNVSKIISGAEQKYGVQLVNRDQTPINLTPAGQRLLVRLNQLLSFEENTVLEMRHLQANPPLDLKMAFFPTYAPIVLPTIWPQLLKRYPTLHLQTTSLTTAKALEALKDGQVAIFIGRNASDPEIISLPLFTEELCFVIDQSSPLYQADRTVRELTTADLVELQRENYVKWSAETSFIDVTEHFFRLNDLHFKSRLTVATYEEAMWCASQGLGTTMAMRTTAEHFLAGDTNVNLLIVPIKMGALEISTMTRKNVDPKVQAIVRTIAGLIQD